MARQKQIDDTTLLKLIQEFYLNICHSNPKKLKLPDIANFIESKGYTNYKVTTLRRNKAARDYIDQLSANGEIQLQAKVSTYKTLDVEAFLNTNISRDSQKRALSQLDSYYESMANAASSFLKEKDALMKKLRLAQEQAETLTGENRLLEKKLKDSQINCREFQKQAEVYKKIIKNYVYPDIANELLAEKELKNVDSIIDRAKLEKNVKTKDSTIIPMPDISPLKQEEEHKPLRSTSSDVIQTMMDDFDF